MATSKLPQVLQLTPATEIVFEGPFEHVVTSYLELKNPSEQRVCFKVKTTAPRRYCVRPNSGIVEPGAKVRIAIMLQPIELESQSERNKHKFMVQSTFIKDENCNLDTVWQRAAPEETMDSKLRCVFSMPDTPTPASATATTQTTNTTPATAEPTSTTSSITTSTPKPTTTAAPATTTSTQQSQVTISQKIMLTAGDGQNVSRSKSELFRTSPPTLSSTTSRTSSASKNWASNVSSQNPKKSDAFDGDKSVASSHNLTASFLQPMSDDKKIVLVSLVMLFIGVILGKYII